MMKKNLETTFIIRLSKEDRLCLKVIAYKAGMSVSEYLRMLLDNATLSIKQQIKSGVFSYEDIETFLDNKLLQRRISKNQARRNGR